MRTSISDSSLLRPVSRLAPIRGRSGNNPTSVVNEEKQQHPSQQQQLGMSIRLVDSNGRPFDTHAVQQQQRKTNYITTIDDGMEGVDDTVNDTDDNAIPTLGMLLSQSLSSSDLHHRTGENDLQMTKLMYEKMKKRRAAAAAAGRMKNENGARRKERQQQQTQQQQQQQQQTHLTSSTSKSKLSTPPAQHTDASHTLNNNNIHNTSKLRVTDFSTDGGMGPKLASSTSTGKNQSSDSSTIDQTKSQSHHSQRRRNASPQPSPHGPPTFHTFSHLLQTRSHSLHSHIRGLDLLSLGFTNLITELRVSKPKLAEMLERVRENYSLLFSGLIENLLSLHDDYSTGFKQCLTDYKLLSCSLNEKVAQLEYRVRLLTNLSASKDSMLSLQTESYSTLETELSDLKQKVISGIKQTTRDVERKENELRKGNAVFMQGVMEQMRSKGQQQPQDVAVSENGTSVVGTRNNSAGKNIVKSPSQLHQHPSHPHNHHSHLPDPFGDTGTSSSSSGSGSVEALTILSHDSRNLAYELQEFIGNVETQQERNVRVLQSLDQLLGKGTGQMEEMVQEVAKKLVKKEKGSVRDAIIAGVDVTTSTAASFTSPTGPLSPTTPSSLAKRSFTTASSVSPFLPTSPVFRQRSNTKQQQHFHHQQQHQPNAFSSSSYDSHLDMSSTAAETLIMNVELSRTTSLNATASQSEASTPRGGGGGGGGGSKSVTGEALNSPVIMLSPPAPVRSISSVRSSVATHDPLAHVPSSLLIDLAIDPSEVTTPPDPPIILPPSPHITFPTPTPSVQIHEEHDDIDISSARE